MNIVAPRLGVLAWMLVPFVAADTRLPAVFSDHMVLQRNQPCPVWGWDEAGRTVTVTYADQTHQTVTGDDGRWRVKLDPLPASFAPRTLHVAGTTEVAIRDVVVGEVWLCAGQSNMGWRLNQTWSGDLTALAARNPHLRLLYVPNVGTQELREDFDGRWETATPETASLFSAIGYHFGDSLQRILGVPVGLINNAWGGSAIETWIRREAIEAHPGLGEMVAEVNRLEAYNQTPAAWSAYEEKKAQWPAERDQALAEGRRPSREPRDPDFWLRGNMRLGNGFGGSLHPILGYGLRGAIWYQGEANASRAAGYYDLFPFMIEQWRAEWGQGDFPFYWAQLPDFMAEATTPGDASWAELREAQTRAQRLPRTGQAVTIDLGEGNDIHPRLKLPVAQRLLRLALHHDYGMADLPYRSPEYAGHTIDGEKILIFFDGFGDTLRTIDSDSIVGFAVCGEDRVWHWADARLTGGHQVEVRAAAVPHPVAVRYAWADNPRANLISTAGLPVTPFRTDDFPLSTRQTRSN
jgi:sialate O-acetylesterase